MAIRIQKSGSVNQKKNLFSKLQGLGFSNFMHSSFISPRVEEREGHLDVESQEILALLKSNIDKLADTSSRIEFMMGELSQIMKKGI